ncbi:hypothetical protein CEXT_347711 [Caerostris extrusa]|uniref:Uncharacterized protein n=1 Tax=Caerostris extrusa TaxID=172846 RepID=A0AAV4SGP3_CAEEX|nr:hypothetical protein CEXT_347711 [Caerostris extrusa]
MKKRGCHAPQKQTTGNVCIANMQTPPRRITVCKNSKKKQKFITLTSRHTALPLTKSQEVLSSRMPSHHRPSCCIGSVISPRRGETMKCVGMLRRGGFESTLCEINTGWFGITGPSKLSILQ